MDPTKVTVQLSITVTKTSGYPGGMGIQISVSSSRAGILPPLSLVEGHILTGLTLTRFEISDLHTGRPTPNIYKWKKSSKRLCLVIHPRFAGLTLTHLTEQVILSATLIDGRLTIPSINLNKGTVRTPRAPSTSRNFSTKTPVTAASAANHLTSELTTKLRKDLAHINTLIRLVKGTPLIKNNRVHVRILKVIEL